MEAGSASQRWLFGPGPDLFLGCGLGYMALFVVLVLAGAELQPIIGLGLIPLISVFTGSPHYGATLLLVYEQRANRRAYALFAVWITAALWAVFYLGLYSPLVGSLLLTVYLTWSPWHYSGQNYGIALMFLRRRGVDVTPLAKRLLYTSFVLSCIMTLLALHAAVPGGGEYAAAQPYRGGVFHLMRLGIASPWWEIAFGTLGLAYFASIVGAAVLLLRSARPADLLPSALLVLTQMVWFSIPPLLRHYGWVSPDGPLARLGPAYLFFWIGTGHMLQYIWITIYYAARDGGGPAKRRFYAKSLVAGSFIWSAPALLYTLSVEGGRLGGVAMGPDVGVLIASAVNLHHFILDGAIWKLREGRVARILIRREEPAPGVAPIEPSAGRPWLAAGVYTIGTLATLAVLGAIWAREAELEPALRDGDLRRAHVALEYLDWLGHDGADDYLKVGNLARAQRSFGEAHAYYQRSLEDHRSASTYLAIGLAAKAEGRPDDALAAFESALELNPVRLDALNQLGLAWLQRGDPERALELLERAASVAPGDPTVRASVERARRRVAERSADPTGRERR